MPKPPFDPEELPIQRAEITRGERATGDEAAAPTVLERAGSFDETVATASEPAPIDLGSSSLSEDGGLRYEASRVLGVGGMGEVRLCRDRRLGRDVALKVMNAEVARDASARARFLREARVQGQLEHPSVVPVYDLGVGGEGEVFFTMKRVRGATLESVLEALRRGDPETVAKYTQRRLLTAFSNVCLAIDFAHARGVLHRDLKPANIMLGDFGEVNVLDWGLAKVTGLADEAVDTALRDLPQTGDTMHGSILGTPGYMAPEQMRGEVGTLDPRTDVYALGAILFEILTLRRMNDGETTQQNMAQTLTGSRRLAERSAGVPPELENLYLLATETDHDLRLRSARALSDAIERYLDGDRDIARRREMAAEHAAAAAEAAKLVERAGAEGNEARATALRETGRALALDPENADAIGTLAALLTTPPSETPKDALADLAASEAQNRRSAARLASVRFASWLLFALCLLLLGVREPVVAALGIGGIASASALAYWMSRRERITPFERLALLLLINGASALLTQAFGPFVLVPSLGATSTMLFVLSAKRRHRAFITATAVATILVPVALDRLGVIPPAYSIVDGGILIHARLLDLGSGALTFLLVVSVAIVIVPALIVGRVRDALDQAEHDLFLHAWQLRQLVPREGRPSHDGRTISAMLRQATRPSSRGQKPSVRPP